MKKNRKLHILIDIVVLIAFILIGGLIYKAASPVIVFSDSLRGISLKNEFEAWRLYASCAEEIDELWISEDSHDPNFTTRIAFMGKTRLSEETIHELIAAIHNERQERADKLGNRWWKITSSIEVFFCTEEEVYSVYDCMINKTDEENENRRLYSDWIEVFCAEESLTPNAVKRLMEIPRNPMYRDYEALAEGKEPGVFQKVMSE